MKRSGFRLACAPWLISATGWGADSAEAGPRLVFANNCTDQSASVARVLAECWSLNIRVVDARLPPEAAHAGAPAARLWTLPRLGLWKAETRMA